MSVSVPGNSIPLDSTSLILSTFKVTMTDAGVIQSWAKSHTTTFDNLTHLTLISNDSSKQVGVP